MRVFGYEKKDPGGQHPLNVEQENARGRVQGLGFADLLYMYVCNYLRE